MFNLGEAQLQTVLKQLQQAIFNHERWYNDLIRTIICQQPYDHHDVAKDSHRQCRFGQWYYNDTPVEVRNHPAFLAIRKEHQRMHQIAASLLHTAYTKLPISTYDYDNFANTLDHLRLEIHTLKREIEESLYNHDPLTGALNRIGMLTSLRALQELVNRRVQFSCVAIMDLDHFKAVNDNYGHRSGDLVLSATARYIIDNLRPYDKVFRYGGEEFLISMPSTDLQAGQLMIERLREGLGEIVLAQHGSKPIHVTASFGLAVLEPDVGVEDIITRADLALYAAKSAGRNCLRTWDASMYPRQA